MGTGGFGADGYDEEPLLQELGINFQHIRDKTLAVLNIARPVSSNLMDDTDLAGPLVFCLLFGSFLLMVGADLKLKFRPCRSRTLLTPLSLPPQFLEREIAIWLCLRRRNDRMYWVTHGATTSWGAKWCF
jgi:hypothetical protein